MKDNYKVLKTIGKYSNKMLNIKVPLIGVFGEGDYTKTHEVLSIIRKNFVSKNYSVCQVIDSCIEEIDKTYKFPYEIFDRKTKPAKQMVQFNNYIYEICKSDQPDLMLIEIPGGILPIDKGVTNDFGILAFQIANSVNFDIAIMNLYFDSYSEEFLSKIEKIFLYRFSIDTVYFNLLNKGLDWMKLREEKRIKLMNIDERDMEIVLSNIKNKRVYRIGKGEEQIKLAADIEKDLISSDIADSI